jgi:DNA-binding response OmpR family regulator
MKQKVLVVDDDPAVRKTLAEVLTLEDYTVQTAEHGGPAHGVMWASREHLLVLLGLVIPIRHRVL